MIKTKAFQLLKNASNVCSTYPFTLFFALLTAVFAILQFEVVDFVYNSALTEQFPGLSEWPLAKFALLSSLGISLFFGLKMLQQVKKWKFLPLAGVVLLAGYFFIFPNEINDWTLKQVSIFYVLVLLHHLWVSFIPFLLQKENDNDFWSYNKSLFTHLAQTMLFVGVLTGGLLLAILAVDNLFNLNIPSEKPYLYVSLFGFIFGSCFVFLLFTGKGFENLKAQSEVPVVLRFFVQYILIPLVLLYALILYAYGVKILTAWELPKGWVSYLIIAYSIVGLLSLLLIHPLSKTTDKTWVRWFDRSFFYSLLPLLVLLFVAIFTRISDYGYTPNRYFVLALALWILLIALYFILLKNARIKAVPVSLFVVGLLSICTPYLNAFHISVESQKEQFTQLLERLELVEEDYIDFNIPIKLDDARQLSDQALFLYENKENAFLDQFLSEKTSDSIFKYSNTYYFQQEFTSIIRAENPYHNQKNIKAEGFNFRHFIDVRDADFVIHYSDFDISNRGLIPLEDHYLEVESKTWNEYTNQTMQFVLLDADQVEVARYDLIPYVKSVFKDYKEHSDREILRKKEDFKVRFTLEDYEFTIQFYELFFMNYASKNTSDESKPRKLEEGRFYSKYFVFVKKLKE